MKLSVSQRGGDVWSPVAMKNRFSEWLVAILFAGASCWFVIVYHAWWRGKPYSVLTLNEALAHTAYYCLALAFAFGPLYRFGLLPARAVMVRRTFGIVGVVCALLHVLLSLIPLWPKFGWEFLVIKHWDLTLLGLVNLVLALWLLKTSLGNAVQRLGATRWFRIQLAGLALLPLVLAHFMVLGKIAKWADWFAGRDANPAPSGTFIIFCVGLLAMLLRVVDALCHVKIKNIQTNKELKGEHR